MIDCGDIEAALSQGEERLAPEHREHLARCEACRALASAEGLAPALASPARATARRDDKELATLFAGVERVVAAEHGPAAWMRARPTGFRVALGLGAVVLLVLAVLAIVPRMDLGTYPPERLASALLALSIALVMLLFGTLRPLHRPAPPRWTTWVALAASIGVPIALALFERGVVPGTPPQIAAAATSPLMALRCFAFGALVAVPVLLLWRALDRAPKGTADRLLLGAGGAGIAANLALQAHCAIAHPLHLLAGHATVVLAYLAGAAITARLDRAR